MRTKIIKYVGYPTVQHLLHRYVDLPFSCVPNAGSWLRIPGKNQDSSYSIQIEESGYDCVKNECWVVQRKMLAEPYYTVGEIKEAVRILMEDGWKMDPND